MYRGTYKKGKKKKKSTNSFYHLWVIIIAEKEAGKEKGDQAGQNALF
jgi:hypothetical protein